METGNLSQSSENTKRDSKNLPNKTVVLTVDRLGAGFLGPYGNTWIETPAMNLLASQSVLFENCFIDSARSYGCLQSLLTGIHAAEKQLKTLTLPDLVREQNGTSVLITDDRVLAEGTIGEWFDEVILLELPIKTAKHCDEIEDTQLARLFAGAIQTLEQSTSSRLIWIHSRGMAGPWDAPLELRNQFADDDDPPPPEIVEPPSLKLDAAHNPDDTLGLGFAYAGQICVLDICLAALLDRLAELFADQQTMFIFAGTRGYPMGEHGSVGGARDDLYEEFIHVPLMIRVPGRRYALTRIQSICQPSDIWSVSRDWISKTADSAADDEHASIGQCSALQQLVDLPSRSACAIICGERQFGFRTPAWYLRKTEQTHQLFVKPDDRWEVNEVSNRCTSITAQLAEMLEESLAAGESGKLNRQPPLSLELAFGTD